MKNKFQILKVIITLALYLSINVVSEAQPPPPPPSGGHGLGGNNPPGAGAPIGEGMFLLLGSAGLYGGKKVFDLRMQLKRK
jgi:hypothetical protein